MITLHSASVVIFLASLGVGVASDIRNRRIANSLVLWLLFIAAVAAIGRVSLAQSPLDALLAAMAGLALWIPFWMLGLLGAGDVKFFAAAAAWIGVSHTWRAALLAALLGGGMGIAILVWRVGVRRTIDDVAFRTRHASLIIENAAVSSTDAQARTFPYALPMACALGAAALFPDALFHLGQ